MSDHIEMSDLSGKDSSESSLNSQAAGSAVSTWSWVAAALLLTLASSLAIFPRLLLFITETANATERRTTLTPLESFLAIQFGIWLSAIAASLILNIPETPDYQHLGARPKQPLLVPLTVASSITAFVSYNTNNVGALAIYATVTFGLIGIWGLWVIVFGDSSKIHTPTGVDEHTSSFIFGNKSAASIKKKKWRKEHKST